MIPVRLSVRNFMCYRGEGAVLDLSSVHLACLSGENGAGKSALLGAITWVLWGKARERVSDDELISQGATEMEVEYEFILGEARYRVLRKRSRKGSSGTTILEIHMAGGPAPEEGATADPLVWRPITGHNVRDTQAKIIELLKMEYDTFINSAFILQGRADEFTVKDPAGRKKVLADILGLDGYDKLEELAKEEAKERKAAMTNLEGQMAGIDRELLRRPEYGDALERVESDLTERQAELTEAGEEVSVLKDRWQDLHGSVRRLKELRERHARRKDEIDRAQVRIEANRARKSELEALLAQRPQIVRGYADWEAAQSVERRFVESISLLRTLEREQSQYDGAINSAEVGIKTTIAASEKRIREYERDLAGRGVLERQLAEAMENVRKLQLVQVQHEDARCLRENLDTRIHTLTEQIAVLEKDGKQLREKLDMIMAAHADGKGHANCPLCETALTTDALVRVQHSYQDDIDEKRREYERKRREQKAANDEFVAANARMQEASEQLRALPVQQKRQSECEQGLRQMDKYQADLEREQSDLNKLKKQLAVQDFAHEERANLTAVNAKMAAIAYSKEEHDATSARVAELKHFNERYHKLESAGSELATVTGALSSDTESLASWEQELQSDITEIALLEPQVETLNEIEALMASKKLELADLEEKVNVLFGTRGELRGKIERCEALQDEKGRLMTAYKTAVEEKSIYDDLTTAFGKKGIQAMIIENIIPELEDEANELLHRMTEGRMSVHFATQRDAKSSKNVIETLDINISDDMGIRAYELYSGGEAFRVNFAVRIALSKLLARRAGTQLQMLVIDEGFGTQDGQGRDRLVHAIRSIQDDFEKILVVTHIEELKGEFPMRIDVVKNETGSYITTN